MASRALKIDSRQSEQNIVGSEPLAESVQPAVSAKTDEKAIAVLAYQFWQERGCPVGSDQEDWFQAERELAVLQRMDENEVESAADWSMAHAEETHSPVLRFPVRSELFQANERAWRRA